jgi:hypothetical protein
MKPEERQAIEPALSALAQMGAPRYVIDDGPGPDETERTRPAVECIARADGSALAVEHTLIEPYDGFVADQMLTHERLGPVRALVKDVLPPGYVFDLTIEPGSAQSIRREHVNPLAAWLRRVIPQLSPPPNHWSESPSGLLDLPVRVYRWPIEPEMPTWAPPMRYRIGFDDKDIEAKTLRRCERALRAKLPKLEAARAEHGVQRTLLVLDNPDEQLTNPWRLNDVVRAITTSERLPAPDYVVVVGRTPDAQVMFSHVYRFDVAWLATAHMIVHQL